MPRPAVGVETTLRRRMGSSSVRDRLTTLSRGPGASSGSTTPHLERRLDRAATPSSRGLGRRDRVLRTITLAVVGASSPMTSVVLLA